MDKREQGKLKVFFGYAAGVGKTYAMLEAAHQAQKEGIDVVVGYVERHTRPDTLTLLDGLEVLPCHQLAYRGIQLQEFDLDGALQRHPKLLLVDELAHSNVQGSRHTKRYQDIEELLRAGINVYTTVNVQHLESLNDLVSSITGVVVNERVPDHVFDLASQVELVDIEPEELVKRLKAGKIYQKRQAQAALNHFFTVENLAALREIAMRRTADTLNRASIQDGMTQSAKAGEHILICLSSSPSNPKVIRTAARMAEAFHSGFTALFVQSPETRELSGKNMKRLRSNLRLAEQLGAQIATVYGTDPAEQIAEYARVSGITKIVMGRMNHRPSALTGQKCLADRLLEQTDLDVYIIPDKQPLYKKPRTRAAGLHFRFSWLDTGKLLLTLAASTALSFLFFQAGFSESNIITVYILGVLLTAVWTEGHLYGALSSLLSVAAFNFFFTVPRYSFEAYDPSYPVTFLIMLLSSMIASSLATRVKTQAQLSAQKSYYTELLLGSSQKLQQGTSQEDCLRIAAEQLQHLFDRPIFYALNKSDLAFRCFPPDDRSLPVAELAVAKWVQKNNKHAGATTDTLPHSDYLFLSVRGTNSVMAVVGIPITGYPLPDAFEKNLMIAILSECGLSLERQQLQEENRAADLHAQKQLLQAQLLRSVSHDLRTPLTNIRGSAGILMESEASLDQSQRHALYVDMYDDCGWLIDLTENLLASSRVDSTSPALTMEPEVMEEVFQAAITRADRHIRDHQVDILPSEDVVMARMNTNLILRVLINLLNNAIRYTPIGSQITFSAVPRGDVVEISVADDGPGISEEAKAHLFDLFYTAGQGKGDCHRGLGLGLPLCQSIAEQHGSRITVEDNHPHGTVFKFDLPRV